MRGRARAAEESHEGRWLVELDSGHGPVSAVAPPGALGDDPLRWPFALTGYGNDEALWRRPRDPGWDSTRRPAVPLTSRETLTSQEALASQERWRT